MKDRLTKIQDYISVIKDVSIEGLLEEDSYWNIIGKINIKINEAGDSLPFNIKILPEYPLKRYNLETISFSNPDLLRYGHVMGNGSICIHTSHCTDLKKKLDIDFNSLKRWILEYYINGTKDSNYEHIILKPQKKAEAYHAYFFTETDKRFTKSEFGFVEFSRITEGFLDDGLVYNNVVQKFLSLVDKQTAESKWAPHIKGMLQHSKETGLFVFIESPPALFEKFIFTNWDSIEPFVNQAFIKFLYDYQKTNYKHNGLLIPLLIGYQIPNNEIHWQVAILEIGQFPVYVEKMDQKWYGHLTDESIVWGETRNCSYEYYFGRGKLNDKLTQGKVLIIGIGAIGSIVATTLTRGGCKSIDIIDYDKKEPENVCRSEYNFFSGISNKTNDLPNILFSISPFVEVGIIDQIFFNLYSKVVLRNQDSAKALAGELKQYDVIIDCSTDNDLLYVLSELNLDNVITLSITNKAKALVCSVEPKSYHWVINQFENVLDNDSEDLYSPTGCWNSTFKASYNDINTLVQIAIKNINFKHGNSLPLRNFTIQTDAINFKLKEF